MKNQITHTRTGGHLGKFPEDKYISHVHADLNTERYQYRDFNTGIHYWAANAKTAREGLRYLLALGHVMELGQDIHRTAGHGRTCRKLYTPVIVQQAQPVLSIVPSTLVAAKPDDSSIYQAQHALLQAQLSLASAELAVLEARKQLRDLKAA